MSEASVGRASPDRETFLKDLNKATQFIRPVQLIDWLTVRNETLVNLGLPAQPDRETEPLAWALWHEFFTPELELIEGGFTFSAIATEFRHYRETVVPYASRDETSSNWSGAYVMPDRGRRFKEIYGIWKVPAVTPPAQGPASPSDTYHSSIFIGLDGQRRNAADSLPQIGTRQDIDATGTHYETWWEWFARGQGNWPTQTPLQVAAGQSVMCWLTVISPVKIRFMMRNLDTPFGLVFTHSARSPISPMGIPGVTAEWVMERPTGKTGDMERLPEYDDFSFHQCIAVADGQNTGRKYHDLTAARLIRMIERRYPPSRGTLISLPARILKKPFVEKTSFKMSYRSGM